MGSLYVASTDPPGQLKIWGFEPSDIPQWVSSDESVVRISSVDPLGRAAMIAYGRPGNARIVVTSIADDGTKHRGEVHIFVANAPDDVVPIELVLEHPQP